MRLTKLASALYFILLILSAHAQQTNSTVSGTIIEKNSKAPVEFANVELLNMDRSFVSLAKIPFQLAYIY